MRNRLVAGHPDLSDNATSRRNTRLQSRGHSATITRDFARSLYAERSIRKRQKSAQAQRDSGLTGECGCVIHFRRVAPPRRVVFE